MAEGVLYNIAGEIIAKLGSRPLREICLWRGVKDELEKLKNTLTMIQAVLLDAEEQYSKSNQVTVWVESLKEVFYEADDLLDEFSTDGLRRKLISGSGNKMAREVRLFFSNSNQFVYGIRMAHKIKAIRDRLNGIAENRSMFRSGDCQLETQCVIPKEREQTHSSPPKVVVGRENDRKAIIELLLSSNYEENVSIVSIVGIGGLGKTTLAQLVYNDEMIKTHFELELWVSVSDNFDVRLIVEKILESASGEKPLNLEMNTLKNLLHEKLNGKMYFLVLDDIWNESSQKWFFLKDLLVGGARGSRILVTTRLKNVAEMIQSDSIYELNSLLDVDSWSLFTKMAFKQGQVPSLEYEKIGKEIIAKCAGVPLAIKIIGRLLYFKNRLSEWLSFKDKELLDVDQKGNGILPTLKLSYNHLPSHLKHCFDYCRLIPKGTVIKVELLVCLWMAQGYIKSSDPKQCLEDIGFEYFMDLLSRSFFQVEKVDIFGGIISCKMHDLMHDLAVSVAGVESILLDSSTKYIDKRALHVSFGGEVDSLRQVSHSLLDTRRVRTLYAPYDMRCKIEKDECHIFLSNLKRLRVLKLHNLDVEIMPHSINKLKHIRYLDLSYNKSIKLLPNSIAKLQNLQVLILMKCEKLKQLPKDIKTLVNLRHLNIWGCDRLTHMPRGLGKLTSLRNLSTFLVAKDNGVSKQSGGLIELHDLNNLRGWLYILNLQYVKNARSEFEAANLKEKQYLQSLLLAWKLGYNEDNTDNDVDNDELSVEELQPHVNLKWLTVNACGRVKFPSWISSLTNLVILRIDSCKSCQRLPPVDQFPYLKLLSIINLTDLEFMESGSSCANGMSGPTLFFPSLEYLWLSNCPNLKGWWRGGRDASTSELFQFHCLASLEIESCPLLTSVPLIPSVGTLVMKTSSKKLLEDVVKMKISAAGSSSSSLCLSPPLSQLKILGIWKIEDLEFLPEDLEQHLTSLQQLDIIHCSRIRTLSHALQHLTSLEILIIEACEELDLSDGENGGDMKWQCLRSLRELQIKHMLKLVSLPKGLQQVPTLRKLIIVSCPNLMYLPEWMANLVALGYLHIEDCPHLSERCKNKAGADWRKIAHISYIKIEGRWIQSNGCYNSD